MTRREENDPRLGNKIVFFCDFSKPLPVVQKWFDFSKKGLLGLYSRVCLIGCLTTIIPKVGLLLVEDNSLY